MTMSLSDKEKKQLKKKIGKTIRKITFVVVKPFLPFIIVIGGIILAISTVSDALFGNEEDAAMVEKLSSEDYEAQYSEWLQYSNPGGTVIQNGARLVPTGMFDWPLSNYTEITSGFGMRLHPVHKVNKMHTGVDVAAPIGADFVAMADGKVTFAKYTDGYGNMVMIDHRKWYFYPICTRFSNISKSWR